MASRISTGERVAFTVSDPWDFVTACGSGPFKGVILGIRPNPRSHDTSLLVRCDLPVAYEGETILCVLIESRLAGRSLDGMSNGEDIPCNVVPIDESRASPENPFDLSVQPPGGFFIGAIRIDKREGSRAPRN